MCAPSIFVLIALSNYQIKAIHMLRVAFLHVLVRLTSTNVLEHARTILLVTLILMFVAVRFVFYWIKN